MASKEIVGTVISNKMNKTIIVAVNNKTAHKKYKKTLPKTKKYFVHDEHNQYKTGDIVTIILTRPLSRHKCWKVLT